MERIIKIIQIAEKNGRKVAVDGCSMKSNVAIAEELKMLTPQKGTIISIEDLIAYRIKNETIITKDAQVKGVCLPYARAKAADGGDTR